MAIAQLWASKIYNQFVSVEYCCVRKASYWRVGCDTLELIEMTICADPAEPATGP